VKSGQKVGEVGGEGGREGRTYHTPAVVVALVAGVILHHLLLLVHIRVSGAILPFLALVVVTLLSRHLQLCGVLCVVG